LSAGADANAVNKFDRTHLDNAVEGEYDENISLLGPLTTTNCISSTL